MIWVVLFVFGTILGSFLNVIATRYNPDRFILSASVIGGRSRCDGCGKQLRFFELVPIASYVFALGRCMRCRTHLSLQYVVAEVFSGVIVATVPYWLFVHSFFSHYSTAYIVAAIVWVIVFELLLLMALIDVRLQLIPDEINVAIAVIGIGYTLYRMVVMPTVSWVGQAHVSLLGSYGLLFGLQDSLLLNRAAAFLCVIVFFAALLVCTRGRGIGLGDVKLAVACSFLFGWPDILFITCLGFVIGAVYGAWFLIRKQFSMKKMIAFGPFFALAAFLLFFWGQQFLSGYFGLFGIL